MTDEIAFLGKGWRFPPTFNKNKKGIEIVANNEDIKNSLTILLTNNIS